MNRTEMKRIERDWDKILTSSDERETHLAVLTSRLERARMYYVVRDYGVKLYKASGDSEKLGLHFSKAEAKWVALPVKSGQTDAEARCLNVILRPWTAPLPLKGKLFGDGLDASSYMDVIEGRRIEMMRSKRQSRRAERSRSRESETQ